MDENAIRQWLIDCFGPIQGEMAWNQLSNMPEAVRDQLMSQDPSTLPKPEEVKSMMQAFTAGGLNTMGDMQQAVEQGPINIKLAKSLALQQANGAGSDSSVNAETGEMQTVTSARRTCGLIPLASSTRRKARRSCSPAPAGWRTQSTRGRSSPPPWPNR